MRIVPGFDVVNGVWFVWEPKGVRVKARTLAELQRKLPADAVIEVYYPDGYPFEVARDTQAAAQPPEPNGATRKAASVAASFSIKLYALAFNAAWHKTSTASNRSRIQDCPGGRRDRRADVVAVVASSRRASRSSSDRRGQVIYADG
jgi:hypothetical protein